MGYGKDSPVDFGDAENVVAATVRNWRMGLDGKPTFEETDLLIKMLTENVESDRAFRDGL